MDLLPNLIAIGVSGLLSLITFLFTAWIRSQVKERILELELRLAREYVEKNSLDSHVGELKSMITALTIQVSNLQRIVDRRFGRRNNEEAGPED